MKKNIFLSLGLLTLAGLSGCGGSKKPVVVRPEYVEAQEDKPVKSQPIKQARTSGTHPKEVGWEDEDYA